MSWEAHRESVTFAKAGLVDLMEKLELAQQAQDIALALVATATGRPPTIDSAQAAFEHTAKIGADLNNAIMSVVAAREGLNDYFNRF